MLLDDLVAEQKRLRATDGEFAELLGVSRQLWQKVRTGAWPLEKSDSTIIGALGAFPELQAEIASFLRQNAKKLASLDNSSAADERESA